MRAVAGPLADQAVEPLREGKAGPLRYNALEWAVVDVLANREVDGLEVMVRPDVDEQPITVWLDAQIDAGV